MIETGTTRLPGLAIRSQISAILRRRWPARSGIVGGLLAEAHRKHPDDRVIAGYTFILEGALGTLRLQSSGGDIGAKAIAQVNHKMYCRVRP